ncbi:MAG: SDR family oxidoreductase [Sandaracinaceae bacterium]|nr:SDR family oxidoreductase [Sandaracinaceae bacterium]
MIKGRSGASGFGYASTAEEVTAGLDLRGKSVLITGVNSGLGQESARVLAMRGARVLGAARTKEKAAEACRAFGPDAVPLACELSEPESVRACVAEVLALGIPLDVLLCNAGIMALPERTTKHGQELQFLTNHIGHFILVTGLLDALTDKGRVVMLSSGAHHRAPQVGIDFDDLTLSKSYTAWTAYGQTKLANLLFAKQLAKRLAGTGKTANALHPGVINTNLGRHMNLAVRVAYPIAAAIAMKDIPQGSATQCYVATHPSLEGVTGEYFADCNVTKPSRHARNEAMAERLWEVTEGIVAGL